jgi:cytochrome c-type biogenesis protein CcmF
MDYLSQLYLPGAVALWCALAFAVASLWGYAQLLGGDETARPFARRAYLFYALAIVAASGVLLLALGRRDFRIEYVEQYSGLDLPTHFQLAAFWAGQKGSFLIWLLWGTLLGLPLARAAGRRAEPAVMGVYTLTLLGLLLILVPFQWNPFVMLTETPVDGEGLNPLLQDPWMVIHPPIMFVGYALSAVPFAFAMAALWRRDYDGWAARAFPWALAGFLVLGLAIMLGGFWAYKTLGWGGYWGWDPVENASLIPWILGVALIHGLHMERVKKRYRRANVVLAALVYLAVLYGTFLTRSGVLADFSVHSFVDLGIAGALLLLMGVFLVIPLWLIATRWDQIPTRENADPLLSRGAFMVMGTIALVLSALLITAGTSAPLLTKFMETPGQVGPGFYNRVNLPLALLVCLLLAAVPFLTWRAEEPRALLRRLVPGAAAAAVVAGVAAILAVRTPVHVLFVFLAALALATNVQKTVARARAGGLGAAGGYLAHVGVGVILLGFIASSAYDQSRKVTLTLNEPETVEDMTLTFTGMLPASGGERERMVVRVVRADGSAYDAYPKMFLNQRTRQLMVNPHVKTFPLLDLYISPIEFDPGRRAGEPERFEMAKGEARRIDGAELRFEGFDLNARGSAIAQLESGGPITVGAVLTVDRDGAAERVTPLYTFGGQGFVDAPPLALPGGGMVRVAGINATAGAVQLDVAGLAASAEVPPRLALDVTKKPLILLVWIGLGIILSGGLLAMAQRARQARVLERVAAGQAAPPAESDEA